MKFYYLDISARYLPFEIGEYPIEKTICHQCNGWYDCSRIGPMDIEVRRKSTLDGFLGYYCFTWILGQDAYSSLQPLDFQHLANPEVIVKPFREDWADDWPGLNNEHDFEKRLLMIQLPKVFAIDCSGKELQLHPQSRITDLSGKAVDLRKRCPVCQRCLMLAESIGTKRERVGFYLADWDGSDLFYVSHVGPVCTEKVLDLFKGNGVRGWKATEVYGFD